MVCWGGGNCFRVGFGRLGWADVGVFGVGSFGGFWFGLILDFELGLGFFLCVFLGCVCGDLCFCAVLEG